jgi:signal transduction histidine kinase
VTTTEGEGGSPSGMHAVFAAGGEMGALMREVDWAGTPLGPVERWPGSLCAAMSICLRSRFPIVIWWGPELVFVYNDAYRPVLGQLEHPFALGRPGREVWPELWPHFGPMLEGVMRRGEATSSEDDLLHVSRDGYLQEAYFTFSFSPVHDESGDVGGVFTVATETTERVLGERRLRTLGELARRAGEARTPAEAGTAAAAALAHDAADVPFALLYLLSADRREARLAWASDGMRGSAAAPEVSRLGEVPAWPLADVVESGRSAEVPDVLARFGPLVERGEAESPRSALVLPLLDPASEGRAFGMLVAGVSPRRPLDDAYRAFFELAAGQIATSIIEASMYDEERRHAEARAELIEDVARTLASTLDLGEVLAMLAKGAARMLSPAHPGQALVLRTNDQDDRQDCDGQGVPADQEARPAVAVATDGASPAFERGLRRHVDYVLRSGNALFFALDQVGTEPERRHLTEAGVGSVALVPITVGEERFGVLAVGAPEARALGSDQLRRLALLADLSGLAIANATAYQREHRALETSQERLRELTLLHDATRTFSSTLSVDAIEREVVRTTARLATPDGAPGTRTTFVRVEGEVATVAHELEGEGPRLVGTAFPVSAHLALQSALAERQARFAPAPDPAEMPAEVRQALVQLSTPQAAIAPVHVQDEPYGAVWVTAATGGGLDRDLLRRLVAVANLAELAIGNARHFETVRREGERMAALEEVKSKFLRLASHELRGPLALLRGYVSMLEDGTYDGRPEELPEVYSLLAAKAGQMEMLVTQMLEAARLEEGRLRPDLRQLDLREPVREAFEDARRRAGTGHDLRLVVPNAPVEVIADAWRVTTIVANLLDNAVKYSPAGGPVRCTVRAERDAAVVEVADRGLGIAEADVPVLFTRFGRIVTTENSHIQGTGLGLYLSRELARMQGGTVTAASEAGVGSTFTLSLPLALALPTSR